MKERDSAAVVVLRGARLPRKGSDERGVITPPDFIGAIT
jgi:hypothetical protein